MHILMISRTVYERVKFDCCLWFSCNLSPSFIHLSPFSAPPCQPGTAMRTWTGRTTTITPTHQPPPAVLLHHRAVEATITTAPAAAVPTRRGVEAAAVGTILHIIRTTAELTMIWMMRRIQVFLRWGLPHHQVIIIMVAAVAVAALQVTECIFLMAFYTYPFCYISAIFWHDLGVCLERKTWSLDLWKLSEFSYCCERIKSWISKF